MTENPTSEPAIDKGRRAEDAPVTAIAVANGHAAGKTVMAKTPGYLPDAIVTYISPLRAVLIRAGRTFFDTLVGMIGMQSMGAMPSIQGFYHNLELAAGVAAMAAIVSIIRNMAQLFSTLEQKFPMLQA